MNYTRCGNCKYFYAITEWSIPKCRLAETKNDKIIFILGKKGICPYHEYKESYGWK